MMLRMIGEKIRQAQLHGGDASERDVLVDAPELLSQVGRRRAVADLPARRVVGLPERAHHEAALEEVRVAGQETILLENIT